VQNCVCAAFRSVAPDLRDPDALSGSPGAESYALREPVPGRCGRKREIRRAAIVAPKERQTLAATATGRDRACLRCVAQYGNLGLGSVGCAQKWNSSLPTAPIGHRHWKRVSCVTASPAQSRPSISGALRSVLAIISPVVRDSLLFIVSVTADKRLIVVPARAQAGFICA